MKHLEIALILAGIAIVFSNVSLIMRDAKHYKSAAVIMAIAAAACLVLPVYAMLIQFGVVK